MRQQRDASSELQRRQSRGFRRVLVPRLKSTSRRSPHGSAAASSRSASALARAASRGVASSRSSARRIKATTRSTDANVVRNFIVSASIGRHIGGVGLERRARIKIAPRRRARDDSEVVDVVARLGGGVAPGVRRCHASAASAGRVSSANRVFARASRVAVAAAGSGVPSGRSRCSRANPKRVHAARSSRAIPAAPIARATRRRPRPRTRARRPSRRPSSRRPSSRRPSSRRPRRRRWSSPRAGRSRPPGAPDFCRASSRAARRRRRSRSSRADSPPRDTPSADTCPPSTSHHATRSAAARAA